MQNALQNIVCIDFEASSLARTGYPIEVAVVDCATAECSAWLIRPTDEWLRDGLWSEESAAVHTICFQDLIAHGQPAALVARELSDRCLGKKVLCDGGEHDWMWLAMLCADSGLRPPVLSDYEQFVRELARQSECSSAAVVAAEAAALSRFPVLHRAGPDARRLAETLRLIARCGQS